MVVIAMLAILLSLAAPSFVAMLKNSRASTLGNEFVMGAVYRAFRSHLAQQVRDDVRAETSPPRSPVLRPAGAEWNSGWIIFSNPKCDSIATDDPQNCSRPISASRRARGSSRRAPPRRTDSF